MTGEVMAWHFSVFRSAARVPDRVLDLGCSARRCAHHHATGLGGTHAYTEVVPDSRDWRPAAGCGPVRRRHRGERSVVRLWQAHAGAEGTRVRPAVGGTRRQGHANGHTGAKLAHRGDPAWV